MVRDAPAVSLSQVATEQAADDRESSADDHEENACCDLACEVGKEEDDNTCVHKDCQHNSRDALRHVLPPPRAVKPSASPTAVSRLTRAVRQMIRDCQRKPYSTAHRTPNNLSSATVFAALYWELQWFAIGVGFAGWRFAASDFWR
jgi:hypothetical protein